MPKTVDDAKTLTEHDKPKFEKWAASLTPGMEADKKQVADGAIDGRGRYPLRKGVFVGVVSQVKGGTSGLGPLDVRAFNGARQQANADMGVFTCFEEKVTNGMRLSMRDGPKSGPSCKSTPWKFTLQRGNPTSR
ncbi:MAG: hypothetical protein F4148_15260 [Caldilineaceae bacterium SB0675_bin_29]|uniref:Uncharacterized protein n=1 Tax=Caldilineaceae bacterium SB0675_bin_29 TaxID=2605266 RepID=A0A6B1G2A1_9CHLR|nr:hypothetical protein [Caldilineaceae bacterium SB0675_bin_29]